MGSGKWEVQSERVGRRRKKEKNRGTERAHYVHSFILAFVHNVYTSRGVGAFQRALD